MKQYAMFLRGVNVNGRRLIMSELVTLVKQAGLTNVGSVQASGNLYFETDWPRKNLRKRLEEVIETGTGLAVPLFVKTKAELEQVVNDIPFTDDDQFHRYIFFHEPGFETTLLEEFEKVTPLEGEQAKIVEGNFYWYCPKGETLTAGFSKILGKPKFKEYTTSRNLNTVEKVLDKMSQKK